MRERVLIAGLACLLLLGLSGLGSADDQRNDACTPAGTWTIKTDFDFIPNPAEPTKTEKFYLQFLQFFTADGRTTGLFPTGAGHPNVGDTRIGCVGEWRRTRQDHHLCDFDLIQRCLYNQAWDGVYGEIIGKLRVHKDGKHLTMRFSYIDYNSDGTVNYDEGTGVSKGTRLEFPRAK